MSLMNGLNAAAKGLSDTLDLGIKTYLERGKMELADQLAGAREEKGDLRRSEIAKDAAETALLNSGRRVSIEGKATEDLAAANAPAQLKRKMDGEKALFDFKTDAGNVRATAEAKALGDSIIAKSAAATQAELMKDKNYVDNLKLMVSIEHPERGASAAASAAAAAASRYKLEAEKEIGKAVTDLANAKTPEEREAARAKRDALQGSITTDRLEQTSRVGVMNVIKGEIRDRELRLGALTKENLGAELTPAQQAEKADLDREIKNGRATLKAYVDLDSKTRGITVKEDAPAAGGVAQPKTQSDFDAVPAGAKYVDPKDGKTYTKNASARGKSDTPSAASSNTDAFLNQSTAPNTSGSNTSSLYAEDIAAGRALQAGKARTQQEIAKAKDDPTKMAALVAKFAEQAKELQTIEAKLKPSGISL